MLNTTRRPPTFTAEQLRHFKSYERVRTGGRFNMFDPRARTAAGLSGDEYRFVMEHFAELRAAVETATAVQP